MKKNKFIGMLLLSFLMVIGMAMSAMAVLVSPASNEIVRDSAFNVTFNTSCACNYTNYTLIVASTLSANTSVVYANVSNSTQTISNFSFYWNASGVEDANNYNVTVIASNNTGSEQFSNANVIVDFTRPAVPSSLTSGRQTSSTVSLTGTVTDSSMTSCTVSFQGQLPTSSAPSCTQTGATATVSLTNANEGSFGYQIIASDGTNTSPSAVTYFNVDLGRGGQRPAQAQVAGQQGQEIAQQAKEGASKIGAGFRNLVASIIERFKSLFA